MKTNSERLSWGSQISSIAISAASVPPPSSVTSPSPWSAGVGVPIRPEIRIRTIETTGQIRILQRAFAPLAHPVAQQHDPVRAVRFVVGPEDLHAHRLGAGHAAVMGAGVEPPPAASTHGLSRDFSARADARRRPPP